VFTLTEATLVADHWGPDRYAAVNGGFNAPLTAAGAIAPGIGAAVAAATGGYPALFAVLAATAAAGAALAAAVPSPGPAGPAAPPLIRSGSSGQAGRETPDAAG
jgi:hypothetical protein